MLPKWYAFLKRNSYLSAYKIGVIQNIRMESTQRDMSITCDPVGLYGWRVIKAHVRRGCSGSG